MILCHLKTYLSRIILFSFKKRKKRLVSFCCLACAAFEKFVGKRIREGKSVSRVSRPNNVQLPLLINFLDVPCSSQISWLRARMVGNHESISTWEYPATTCAPVLPPGGGGGGVEGDVKGGEGV